MALDPQTARRIEMEAYAQVDADPHGALERAKRIWQEAQTHKHAARRHDRRAAVSMVTYKAFKKRLEALGIEVIIERQATDTRSGGTSDGSINRRY